jgi:hypothetical protein
MSSADFNGDGKMDIVIAGERSVDTFTVVVLFGSGNGTFPSTNLNNVGGHPS